MSTQIFSFVLETVFFALIGAAWVRAYLDALHWRMSEQPARFASALTDWLVRPLRRVLPKRWTQWRWDAASVLAAVLLALIYALIWLTWQLVTQAELGSVWSLGGAVLALALKMLLRVLLQVMLLLVLTAVVVSWTQPGSSAYYVLTRLTAPLLAPLRRILPIVGGVDVSALVLLVLLQIAMLILI